MLNFKKSLLATTAGLTLILSSSFVHAQDDSSALQSYETSFFDAFAPRTALDMISRVPGFQLDDTDSRRGLGQGGANLLINGERLTGKTNVVSQLSRIPAKNVMKIEIKDGASLNITGLSGQVANIVTKTNGVSGTWSWAPQFRHRQVANWGHAHLTVSGETGNLSYSAEVRNESRRNGRWGPETVTAADGAVFERREETERFNFDGPGATVDLNWKPRENHIGNLNLEYNQGNFEGREISYRVAVTERGQNLQTQFSNAEDEWNAKIGADYELPFLSGKIKTTGYYRAEYSPTVSQFNVFETSGQQTSGSRFSRNADEGEAIARTEYSWSPKKGRDWQLSLEAAFNYLDIESNLLVFDNGTFVNEPLDGATARVEEKRAESTLTHSRKLSSKVDMQLSLGSEYSELIQTNGLSREFFRPKGFLTATYKPNTDLSIRAKIEREVGQLSFFDFISSVDIQDNLDRAGNINLVPNQSWNGSLEFDRNLKDGNSFKTRFYAEFISDLVDRVPVTLLDGTDGDAVGNIDNAFRYGLDIDATLMGEKWGYKGTQLDLEFDWRDSNVKDPLILTSRPLNNDKTYFWRVNFRHDIPNTNWAYNFSANQYKNAGAFRLNSFNDFHFSGPFAEASIEHKDVLGMKVVVSLLNVFNGTEDFKRKIFTNRRDRGVLDFTEANAKEFGPILNIEFSGTF